MSARRDVKGRIKARRRRFSIESLESRVVMSTATESFAGPSLAGLIPSAEKAHDVSPAIVSKMAGALKTQLLAGPFADLESGAADADQFVVEAQELEIGYKRYADAKLGTKLPNVDELVDLQGRAVVAQLLSLNQQESVGLISGATLASSSRAAIASLTNGPIKAYGTPTSALTTEAKVLENELNLVSSALGAGRLTVDQTAVTIGAEAEAFRAEVHAGIQMTHLQVSGQSDAAINALENNVVNIAQAAPSDAASQVDTAIKAFDGKILDTKGIFAPGGSLTHSKGSTPKGTNGQVASLIVGAAGTSTVGGTGTLTATLVSFNGSPIAGQLVAFSVDGAFAGVGVTSFKGVATVTGVPTTDALGTDAGGVVAYFAGNTNFLAASTTGNLVVSASSTTLGNVSGTATFGGTATLSATLTSTSSGGALAGRTVSFSLDGNSVGTAVTNGSGVATLNGVPTTHGAGTDTAGIVATFAGGSTVASASASGNLVIGQASTTLAGVSGTASLGGTATLEATLTSSVTGRGVAGENVNFTLDGVPVGGAVTNSDGVASIGGINTSDRIGTDSGGVVASFAGDSNYSAAANATGNLVVGLAATTLGNVAGTASYGGKATLTASLTSTASGAGLAGETVDFSLNGTSVGSAVTDSTGIAKLTGVTANESTGTVTSAVTASFAGDSTHAAAVNATGNLVVTAAPTTLASVGGTAPYGGPATLTATLTSSTTNLGVAGETITFTLGDTSVGSAVTDANGVATLSNVATTDSPGTNSGVVGVNFAGDANYNASTGEGNLVVGQAATSLGNVSGTASVGGTATLKATLTTSSDGKPVDNQTINFTLDGVSVGSAVTTANGVATLAGVTTTDGLGTDAGGIVASFAGNAAYGAPANAKGDLVVGLAATSLGTVSGTAKFGGTATLTATLTSAANNKGVPGQTLVFTLDGKGVGTAVTNGSGVATLTNVATTDGLGTDTGGVSVSFAGSTNYSASSDATGDLVIGQATTALASVSGTATFGGKATLSATLTSTVTGQPLSGQTVNFLLDGKSVGNAVTNPSGVATLPNVATTDGAGTNSGAVTANYDGGTDYLAATNAKGDLVVGKAATALASVSGTAPSGGPAVLMATLTSTVTGQGISGETVSFMLDGKPVGNAVTNDGGVATLPNVATTDTGTDTGGVTVAFAGDDDYDSSNGTGDLVVS